MVKPSYGRHLTVASLSDGAALRLGHRTTSAMQMLEHVLHRALATLNSIVRRRVMFISRSCIWFSQDGLEQPQLVTVPNVRSSILTNTNLVHRHRQAMRRPVQSV
jgi:hypothetical protein